MGLDPYAHLGVPRDADEPTIRKAYRRRSKTDHPNAGGKAEDWEKTSTALTVLVDPKRRKAFDDTGRIEDGRPVDNDRAQALQMIEAEMGMLLNAYIAGGFKPEDDPRKMDVPRVIRTKIEDLVYQAKDGIKGGQKVVAFFRDMLKRFHPKKGAAAPGEDDPILRGITRQIESAEGQIAGIRVTIRCGELALKIVDGYRFDADPADDNPYENPFVGGVSMRGFESVSVDDLRAALMGGQYLSGGPPRTRR